MLQEVLAVASTVLLSLGGAGAIILGLSSWLGRVWAEKILQNARYEHELRVEKLRAQLQRDVESELERLRYRNHGEIDEMMRTREVYQCLVTSMRVFLSGSSPATEQDKKEFLATYDLCHLWASDQVIKKLGEFLDLMVKHSALPDPANQIRLRVLYLECLVEMRRDSGFGKTALELSDYKVVSL